MLKRLFAKSAPKNSYILLTGKQHLLYPKILEDLNHCYPGKKVLGITLDKEANLPKQIAGMQVLGRFSKIDAIIRKTKTSEVVIIDERGSASLRKFYETLKNLEINISYFYRDPKTFSTKIQPLTIEDLYKVSLQVEEETLRTFLNAKNIMVIGAGGEIGGNICWQAARFGPLNISMVDLLENPLYENYTNLVDNYPAIRVVPLLGKAHDPERMEELFAEHKPAIVVYAAGAGHKRPDINEWLKKHGKRTEAFKRSLDSNIHGLMVTISKAIKYGVEQYIYISPVNVEDCKHNANLIGEDRYLAVARLGEAWLQFIGKGKKLNCYTVRFKVPLDSSKRIPSVFEVPIGRNTAKTQKRSPHIFAGENVNNLFLDQVSLLTLYCGAKFGEGDVLVLKAGEIKTTEPAKDMLFKPTTEHPFVYKDKCSFYDKSKLQKEIQLLKSDLKIDFIGF